MQTAIHQRIGTKIDQYEYLSYHVKEHVKVIFITYIARSERAFGKEEAVNRGAKNHLQKIREQLNKTPRLK